MFDEVASVWAIASGTGAGRVTKSRGNAWGNDEGHELLDGVWSNSGGHGLGIGEGVALLSPASGLCGIASSKIDRDTTVDNEAQKTPGHFLCVKDRNT